MSFNNHVHSTNNRSIFYESLSPQNEECSSKKVAPPKKRWLDIWRLGQKGLNNFSEGNCDHVITPILTKVKSLQPTISSVQKEMDVPVRQQEQDNGSVDLARLGDDSDADLDANAGMDQKQSTPELERIDIENKKQIEIWLDGVEMKLSTEIDESIQCYNVGCDYHDDSDYEECIPQFKVAFEGPMRAPSAYHLGTSYVKLEEYAEALPYLEIALNEPWDTSVDPKIKKKCLKIAREDLAICVRESKNSERQEYEEEGIPKRDLLDEIQFQRATYQCMNRQKK